jgi:hypothetical protein
MYVRLFEPYIFACEVQIMTPMVADKKTYAQRSKVLIPGHTGIKWQSWDSNPLISDFKTIAIFSTVGCQETNSTDFPTLLNRHLLNEQASDEWMNEWEEAAHILRKIQVVPHSGVCMYIRKILGHTLWYHWASLRARNYTRNNHRFNSIQSSSVSARQMLTSNPLFRWGTENQKCYTTFSKFRAKIWSRVYSISKLILFRLY